MRKILIALVMATIATSLFMNSANAANELVLYYDFEEGEGSAITDMSGYGNGAVLTGSPTWSTGKYGGGLTFDGVNDLGTVADDPTIDFPTGSFTVAFWIKPNVITWTRILAKGGDPTAGYNIKFHLDKVYAFLVDADETVTVSSNTVATETWQHVVLVVSPFEAQFYVNGNPSGAAVDTTTLGDTSNAQTLLIGGTGELDGDLDEVRIYNYAMSSVEVDTLYLTEIGVVTDAIISQADWMTFGMLLIMALVSLFLAWKSNVPIINFVFGVVTLGTAVYLLGSYMVLSGWINLLAILMATLCMLSGAVKLRDA